MLPACCRPEHLMGLRYIGSKARVAEALADLAGEPQGFLVDAMAGTGAVAAAAARRGWPVRLNDALLGSVCLAAARVVARENVPFVSLGGYEEVIRLLGEVTPVEGTMVRHYSPASLPLIGLERRYFTVDNAAAIDGIRAQIGNWRRNGEITLPEERLLIGDVLEAANSVANTAGTYGCFLREWSPVSKRPLLLKARTLLSQPVPVEVHHGDVADVPMAAGDTAYFDPPYTKRQYAAYYHIQETIAFGDEPEVAGVTGLRPWHDLASDFCYRRRALDAIVRMVTDCSATRVLLSYSDEGHVSQTDLTAALAQVGAVNVHEVGQIGRYRPNASASAARSVVQELVFEVIQADLLESEGPCDAPQEVLA